MRSSFAHHLYHQFVVYLANSGDDVNVSISCKCRQTLKWALTRWKLQINCKTIWLLFKIPQWANLSRCLILESVVGSFPRWQTVMGIFRLTLFTRQVQYRPFAMFTSVDIFYSFLTKAKHFVLTTISLYLNYHLLNSLSSSQKVKTRLSSPDRLITGPILTKNVIVYSPVLS